MIDQSQRTAEFLAVVVENAELHASLAEMHSENTAPRAQLAQAERDRDAWRAEAERVRRTG